MKVFALLSIFAVSAFGATINQDCPMSGNPIKKRNNLYHFCLLQKV